MTQLIAFTKLFWIQLFKVGKRERGGQKREREREKKKVREIESFKSLC